jgi:hypothetical protein
VRPAVGVYAVLFAAAAAIGLTLGYLLDFTHVAWAAAAAMFIMRPDPGLLASRAVGRALATFAGVVAAGLVLRSGPTDCAGGRDGRGCLGDGRCAQQPLVCLTGPGPVSSSCS